MTRTDPRALLLALVAALAACAGTSSREPPELSHVSPPQGAAHRPRGVEIHGDAFRVRPVVDVSEGGSVDARFRAWLGTTELGDVMWEDEQTLTAVVPAGIPPGVHALTIEDPYGQRATLADAYEATLEPAELGVGFVGLPASVNVGQALVATVRVRNEGQAAALGVVIAIGASPNASVSTAGVDPAPVDIPGGEEVLVSRTFTASAPMTLTISADAKGTDALTGLPLEDDDSAAVSVQAPAGLDATFTVASPIDTGDLSLVLSVRNTGGATLRDVAVGPLSVSGVAVQIGAPPPPVAQLAGGETATFTWPLRLLTGGTLQIAVDVTGTDVNDGRTLTQTASVGAPVREAALLAADPFGDGTPFAFVTGYRGEVVLGPGGSGDALVRMAPDGGAATSVPLSFRRDSTGFNQSTSSASFYDGIGFTGCTDDGTLFTCGPDIEDGRGLLESFVIGSTEWLLVGGARSGGDLDYVYVTSGAISAPTFSYVDLSSFLGDNTRGISAVRAASDRLYLGFADNGSRRPYGTVLLRLPASGAAGLDASASTVPPDAIDLELHNAIPAIPGWITSRDAITMVDEIVDYKSRIYMFSDVGCIRSSGPTPVQYGDFADCSPPSGPGYDPLQSVAPPRQYDLAPRDRAWPRAVVWQGRLHVLRNTTTGPQLWSCDPSLTGDTAACDPVEWTLVSPDASYRTRLGAAGAQYATLLAATDRYLYVGFDDPSGVRVYRTDVARPLVASDFVGAGGCLASDAACAGLGGNGLGVGATRVRDAKALSFANRRSIYAVVGNVGAPAQVVRIRD